MQGVAEELSLSQRKTSKWQYDHQKLDHRDAFTTFEKATSIHSAQLKDESVRSGISQKKKRQIDTSLIEQIGKHKPISSPKARSSPTTQLKRSSSGRSILSDIAERAHDSQSTFYLSNEDKDGSEQPPSSGRASEIGPLLVKLARSCISTTLNPHKALEYATEAVALFERRGSSSTEEGKANMELVMSLHILSAVYCKLGQYGDAIAALERSLRVTMSEDGMYHSLAAFSSYMQLGDTLALVGRQEKALAAYHAALQVQKQALGEMDPRVGDTCRYIGESHMQVMQFKQAEELCEHLLKLHSEWGVPGSVEEAADRKLMALICNGLGDHERALYYLMLVRMVLVFNGLDLEVAAAEACIGDTYACLGQYDDASFAYHKALNVLKSAQGEDHATVASVYFCLSGLYIKLGKMREAKIFCESALRIYTKEDGGHKIHEIASGLTEIASIYEAMDEPQQAVWLLEEVLQMMESLSGAQNVIAGIEGQIGILYRLLGKFEEAFMALDSAVAKMRSGTDRTALLGLLLNQLGLTCVELHGILDAVKLFEEARSILKETCGLDHSETLAVCRNLAGTYDVIGRVDEAIHLLKHIIEVKEQQRGSEHPDIEEDKAWLRHLQSKVV